MTQRLRSRLSMGLVLALCLAGGWWWTQPSPPGEAPAPSRLTLVDPHAARAKKKPTALERQREAIERMEYERRRLADPRTGTIPPDIRRRELALARRLPRRAELALAKGAQAATWTFHGPNNVGGRTRALAVDLDYNGTSNRRILAGGISGGVYLSEDGGQTWRLTTSLDAHPSVSTLVQDPNNRNVWYYGTGEFYGGSAGVGGPHLGQGLFKSTDGGETWTQIPVSGLFGAANNPGSFDDFFDIIWKLVVHPQNSTLFAATYGGILRSTDGGSTWTFVLGRSEPPYNDATDIVVAADGSLYAALSRNGGGFTEYGVYRSADLGANWTNITPAELATDPYRMAVDAAPSDANTVYVLAQTTQAGDQASAHQLFRYNAGTNAWTNLSAALPNVTQPDAEGNQPAMGNASFSSQGGYDLLVRVKPDDPNVVWIGGTNLYRSTNGGQSFELVGGYANPYNYALYENHHPDQHSMAFLPNAPNTVISGHDGGLSISTNALQSPHQWTSLNNGYITTQFYTVALDPQAGSTFMLGGLQDNGTWGTDQPDGQSPWVELGSGDGGYGAIAPGGGVFYVSSQFALIIRSRFLGGEQNLWAYSIVQPAIQNPQFQFVAPFELDPNDPRVMYLAEGDGVWRNSNLDAIPDGNGMPTTTNWTKLTNSAVPGTFTAALTVSKNPQGRLVFGTTDYQSTTHIIRVDNPAANGPGTDITPPGITAGSSPSSIAMNPNNADEMIVTFSNYNVPSVFYSPDGGQTWTDIEGNLAGADGPSVRWATIAPSGSGTTYLLATSTGVYATNALSGTGTVWAQEGAEVMGNVVVDMIKVRQADGYAVAATHGRGVYSTTLAPGQGGGGAAVATVSVPRLTMQVRPGESASADFQIHNTGAAPLNFTLTTTDPGKRASSRITALNRPPTLAGGIQVAGAGRRMPELAVSAPAESRLKGSGQPGAEADMPTPQAATDVLVLDDGDSFAGDFLGFGTGDDVTWANQFDLSDFGAAGFRLEQVSFYMSTGFAATNVVDAAIFDAQGTILDQGTGIQLPTAPFGDWFSLTLSAPLEFAPGSTFFVEITSRSGIGYPAGVDVPGQIQGKSYYLEPSSNQYVSISTIPGYETGAFLIRALGTRGQQQNENQPPVVQAQISTDQATVDEAITFDASGSTDPDGQIAAYLWNFGDGQTSNQATTTHAYAEAGIYNIAITVTDDDGASSQLAGQITVTEAQQNENQPPVVQAQISTDQATVDEAITFDASGSTDPDGQIAAYLWNFGDGQTSNQATTTHAYAEAGVYNVSITVTDDDGASAQASGQITVTGAQAPARLTLSASSGTVQPGGSQTITATFDAADLAEGSYTGQITLASNGGSVTIPVEVEVTVNVAVEERVELPHAVQLHPNYPNPFNPETTIRYDLPEPARVTLTVYDVRGRRVRELAAGQQPAGTHEVRWDGRDASGRPVASGVYLYRLDVAGVGSQARTLTGKMTLLK